MLPTSLQRRRPRRELEKNRKVRALVHPSLDAQPPTNKLSVLPPWSSGHFQNPMQANPRAHVEDPPRRNVGKSRRGLTAEEELRRAQGIPLHSIQSLASHTYESLSEGRRANSQVESFVRVRHPLRKQLRGHPVISLGILPAFETSKPALFSPQISFVELIQIMMTLLLDHVEPLALGHDFKRVLRVLRLT